MAFENMQLPAANFLRELNEMLYRERESVKRHDEAMGNIGLRTATFKYQMEQDARAREERKAAVQYQKEQDEKMWNLRLAQDARAKKAADQQWLINQQQVNEIKRLNTPADFTAYSLISRNDSIWQNTDFVADMERQFGGKFNPKSGGFIGQNGRDNKYAPIKLREHAPALIGIAGMYQNNLSRTITNIQDANTQIAQLDKDYKAAEGEPGKKIRIARKRSTLIANRDKLSSALTPANIVGHYRNEKDKYNRLSYWAQSRDPQLADRFRAQANDNAKLETEALSRILVANSGGSAELKQAWNVSDPNDSLWVSVSKDGMSAAPRINGNIYTFNRPSTEGPKDLGKYAEEFAVGKILPPSGPNMVGATPEQVAASQAATTELAEITKREGPAKNTAQAQDQGERAALRIVKRHNQWLALYTEIVQDDKITDKQRAEELDEWKDKVRNGYKDKKGNFHRGLGYIPVGPLRLADTE